MGDGYDPREVRKESYIISSVDLREVVRRWARAADKWVWSTQPRFVFEEDGTERDMLAPVDEVLPEHYEDEVGWWTCHPDTHIEDLAVIYRNAGRGDPEAFPVRGPRDLCYVVLVTSNAFPLKDEPLADRFSGHYGCRFVVVARFEPPIGIEELRRDPILRQWGALKAGFVRAAMSMPDEVWDRLIELVASPGEPRSGAVPAPRGRRKGRQVRPDPINKRRLEYRLEDWLEAHPESLRAFGYQLAVEARQVLCTPDHEGTIDLLCRRLDRKDSYVVIELKAAEVRRDAIAQALGYVGWLRTHIAGSDVSAIVIGIGEHIQVPWVIEAVDGIARLDWSDFDLPGDLRDELGVIC